MNNTGLIVLTCVLLFSTNSLADDTNNTDGQRAASQGEQTRQKLKRISQSLQTLIPVLDNLIDNSQQPSNFQQQGEDVVSWNDITSRIIDASTRRMNTISHNRNALLPFTYPDIYSNNQDMGLMSVKMVIKNAISEIDHVIDEIPNVDGNVFAKLLEISTTFLKKILTHKLKFLLSILKKILKNLYKIFMEALRSILPNGVYNFVSRLLSGITIRVMN
ncbi:hypothetical protein WA026_002238 [Henosepilachna vigintioctopunctata]|uniref:Uncharacterized protein n=1 Tax=Henosepilachna vigintioctopunctata TaxID=420089 RepID=A0AAW1TYW3_9CUCU